MTLLDVRPGLVQLLSSNASIDAIVRGRIYPVKMLQGVSSDSIVYNLITENETYKYDGPSSLLTSRFQFDAWSQLADGAMALANLVKETLGGFSGIIAGVSVQGIFYIDGRTDWDNAVLMYRVSRDYYVWFGDHG